MGLKLELPADTVPRRGAILIADQCGFTKNMLERGPEFALAQIHALRRILVPLFRDSGGEVYKVEADNHYVFFRDPTAALVAALRAHEALAHVTKRDKWKPPLAVGIGIGHGDLLYIASEDDYYGAEVNLASKLGEDTAEGGETLMTESAAESLSPNPPGKGSRWRSVAVSHVKFRYRSWTS